MPSVQIEQLVESIHVPGAIKPEHIELLYELILGRKSDPGGKSAYLEYAMGHPELRLIDLASVFFESTEFRSKHTKLAAYAFEDRLIELSINGIDTLIPDNDWVYAENVRGDKSYEPWVAQIIRNILKNGSTFLDIGANVGVHTMVASELVGTTGRVYAVDASIENCRVIQSSARRYERKNIVIVPLALSDAVRLENISIDSTGSNKVVRRDKDPALEDYNFETILCGTLDGSLPPFERLDLIKVDVEGREGSVLRGARRSLSIFNPPIIAEYHPAAPETYFVDDLVAQGYEISILGRDENVKFVGSDHALLDTTFESMKGDLGATHLDLLFQKPAS
ncbi:MAG: FkbM family methyltransferase [Alphaproteobacteria bacterium]|nr:FkbM family methyltransferase [Alphaproteobacteria bacterium]